ncbi:MAG: hypothetical protein ACOC0P_05395, partial [Planctomycetota bacterium]
SSAVRLNIRCTDSVWRHVFSPELDGVRTKACTHTRTRIHTHALTTGSRCGLADLVASSVGPTNRTRHA